MKHNFRLYIEPIIFLNDDVEKTQDFKFKKYIKKGIIHAKYVNTYTGKELITGINYYMLLKGKNERICMYRVR